MNVVGSNRTIGTIVYGVINILLYLSYHLSVCVARVCVRGLGMDIFSKATPRMKRTI